MSLLYYCRLLIVDWLWVLECGLSRTASYVWTICLQQAVLLWKVARPEAELVERSPSLVGLEVLQLSPSFYMGGSWSLSTPWGLLMTGQQKQQAPPHSRSSEGAQTGPEASPSISVATILLSQRLLFCYSLIISSPCFLSRFFLTLKVRVRFYILFKVFYLFVLISIYVFYFYF